MYDDSYRIYTHFNSSQDLFQDLLSQALTSVHQSGDHNQSGPSDLQGDRCIQRARSIRQNGKIKIIPYLMEDYW